MADLKNFCSGTYVSQSPLADQEECQNLYPEKMESGGASTRIALFPTPGVSALPLRQPTIVRPGAITITNQGAAGATTYGYVVVGLLTDGVTHSDSSVGDATTTGNAVLSGADFNRLTWGALANAAFYQVYRVAGGPSPPTLLATTTLPTYDDIGGAGTPTTPPSTDTTGQVYMPPGTGKAQLWEASSGRLFRVVGSIFGEVTASNLFIWRGVVAQDANPATLVTNGSGGGQIFITAGGNGYLYDFTTETFSTIAALAGKATQGGYLDGFFFSFDVTTSTVFISDLLDGTTWDPTQFVQRSDLADPWLAMLVAGKFIWLNGAQTGSAWFDAGTFPVPIQPHPSGIIQFGVAAPFGMGVVGGQLVFLAATINGQGQVVKMNGFTPEIISTFPVSVALNSYPLLSDAIAFSYDDLGHTFFCLTFPSGGCTWVWDIQTQLWHKRQTWISEESRFSIWRPCCHAFAFGTTHVMLDFEAGESYEMSSELFLDVESRPIRRVRRSPGIVSQLQRIYYGAFILDVEVGLGANSGQGIDPTAMLRTSDDGGKTWSSYRNASIGAQGDYGLRVMWERNGSAYRRVWEVTFTDPIPFRILAAYLEDVA